MSLKKEFSKTKDLCKVTFSLPTEAVAHVAEAIEVKVLGDFNDWAWENGVPMKATKKEYKATVELPAGKDYQFRYLINQTLWENDWAADNYVASPFDGIDNSVVTVPATAKTTKKKTKGKTATAKKAAAKKSIPKAKKVTSAKNDLKKIEGIGPKIATLLSEAGFKTFADLSTAKKADLKKVLEAAGSRYKMHDPTTWPKQAKLAAKGQWEELAKLQSELKGGKA